MDITAATYCIAAQGGTIGGHHDSQLHCITAQGGTIGGHHDSQLHCITAQGGTIGEHHDSQLLYRSPRGDHWWTLPQPLTVLQPKGGPLVSITAATYCITAQGGTIGGHYRSHLLYRSSKGGPLVDITIASYCIAAKDNNFH